LTSTPDGASGRALREGLVATLLLTVASLALWGNAVMEMAKFLPIVHRLADPTLYPGDADVDALLRIHTWALRLYVPFERLGALDAGLLLGTILARAGLAAGALAVAAALARDRLERYAAAAAVVLAYPSWAVAGEFELLGAEGSPGQLAVPFGLVALGLALRGRPLAAGLWVGLGANLHPMALAACVPLLLGAALAGEGAPRDRLRAAAVLAGAALIAALPTVVWVLLHAVSDTGGDPALARQLLLSLVPDHLLWSAAPSARQRELLTALLLLPLLWPRERGEGLRRALGAMGVGLAALVVDVALVESGVAPLLLVKACGLRISMWTGALTRVAPGLRVVEEARRGDAPGALGAGLLVAGCIDAPPLLALAALLLAAARWRRGELPGWAALLLGALPVALQVSELERGLAGPLLRGLLLGGLLLGGAALARRTRPGAWPGLAAGGALAAWLVLRVVTSPPGLALPRLDWRPEVLHPPEHVELARWAATSTPRSARFLIHPTDTTFLAYSRRPMVASTGIVTLSVWDVRLASEQLARLRAIGAPYGGGPDSHAAYQVWTPVRVAALAERFEASYVVVERFPHACQLPWPVAFQSPRFVVYERPAR